MTARYKNQNLFTNAERAYRNYLKSRGLNSVTQFSTAKFRHPTVRDVTNFNTISHIWTTGDRYFKLAHEFYGDAQMWWVIALYNQKPTEFHLKVGDVIYIPTPLETVLFYIGY